MKAKHGDLFDKERVRSKQKNLRTLYWDVNKLIEVSGFGWDKTRCLVTAETSVWDDFITEINGLKKYHNKSLPDIDSRGQIFVPVSTGPPVDANDSSLQGEIDEEGEESSKRSQSQTPNSRSKKKKSSPCEVIAEAMAIVAESMRNYANTQAKASTALKKKCMELVSDLCLNGERGKDEIIKASQLFQNSAKAEMFMILEPEYRTQYLWAELEVERGG
ncbi:uncharacterized protein LOC18442261 [Amborella trichopoda]|uniref:uncharacterized protein LOC18442261 n=1 Tax=Amborella trichopoda TaxID=13333 RepID=UPI0005D2F239|nr:uncharacterized protein LOC18442261 [Amborella trichopoda]|eukprot:XP_011626348.1 uncharacterized protein LOC18442261 [Amborella trichopoda]